MKRRALLALLAILASGAPAARAQRAGKIWRVGFLSARKVDSMHSDPVYGTFLPGLRELGYVEGRNLVLELRHSESDAEHLNALARELAGIPVDVIVTAGATPTRAAQRATSSIPIVMGTAGDPVGAGFAKSLARPGGNITGLTDVASDMGLKFLDFLKAALPSLRHVAVMFNPANPSHPAYLESVREGGRGTGVKVMQVAAGSEADINNAFSVMAKAGVDGAIALPDPIFNPRQRQIARLAAELRLPCISGVRQYVQAGGLMNYGPDFSDNFRRAATYVDKILKGAKPADLPIEQSARFELAVNLKAAKALGLTLPGPLLARADVIVDR